MRNAELRRRGMVQTLGAPALCVSLSACCGHLSPFASPAPPEETEFREPTGALTSAWKLPGEWSGIDVDEDRGLICGLTNRTWRSHGAIVEPLMYPNSVQWSASICWVNGEGTIERTIPISSDGESMACPRLARLDRSGAYSYARFAPHHQTVCVFDQSGSLLWKNVCSNVVEDIVPIDLDGDGLDELLVGMTGGGIKALNARGDTLWRGLDDGWIISMDARRDSAGDVNVVAASLGNFVSVLDSLGGCRRRIPLENEPIHVRITADDADKPVVLAASNHPLVLTAHAVDGAPLWKRTHPQLQLWYSLGFTVDAVAPLAATVFKNRRCYVYDTRTGEELGMATVATAGFPTEFAFASDVRQQSRLLVVATAQGLAAFHVNVAE